MKTLKLSSESDTIQRVVLYSSATMNPTTTNCDENCLTIITRHGIEVNPQVAVVLVIKIKNTMTQFMYQRRLYQYALRELRNVCHLHPRCLLYLSEDGSVTSSIVAEVHFTTKGVDKLMSFFEG